MIDKTNHEESFNLLKDLSFCVFDLETTGGNHTTDKIIEIGLVRIENFKVVAEKSYLVNPGINIPDFIQKLTNIHPEDLVNSPSIEEIIEDIIDFIGDSILVAHNTSFDVPFINSVITKLNLPPLKNKVICTNLMTKYLIPGIMSSNLPYMSEIFNIEHKEVHRAVEDAKATAQLLLNYLNFFIKKDIKKVNQLYYPRNRFELDRTNFTKETDNKTIINKIKDIKSPIIITIKGEQGLLLTSIPVLSPKDEIEFIDKSISNAPWESVTIHLAGSFLEALLNFNQHFNKGQKEYSDATMKYLQKLHLADEIKLNVFKEYDFIIGRHIVNEQFAAYSVNSLTNRAPLIFRFPTHKKKLSQFINSCMKKIAKGKISSKKSSIAEPIIDIINSHLQNDMANTPNNYLLLKNEDVKASNRSFNKKIENHTKQSLPTMNYPKEHI